MPRIHFRLVPLRNANQLTNYVLTTDSPKSRDGIPALVIIGLGSNRGDYRPEEALPLPEYATAADLVAEWGNDPRRTPAERAAAHTFCAAWANGPQILPGRGQTE